MIAMTAAAARPTSQRRRGNRRTTGSVRSRCSTRAASASASTLACAPTNRPALTTAHSARQSAQAPRCAASSGLQVAAPPATAGIRSDSS